MVKDEHPLRNKILERYNSMVSSVQNHTKIPSFCTRSTGKAQTVELKFDGTNYSTTLTDTNNVLENYTFTSDTQGVSFNVNGNKLTITSTTAENTNITINARKNNSQRKGLITWTDGTMSKLNDGQEQDVVGWTESVDDPVQAFLKISIKEGNIEIIKTSENGRIEGIELKIEGQGISKTVTTGKNGRVMVERLLPGEYRITEKSYEEYEPQPTKTVTVIAGTTTPVSFRNKLRRGNIELIKTSEDGKIEGIELKIEGQGISKTVTTGKNGRVMVERLLPRRI